MYNSLILSFTDLWYLFKRKFGVEWNWVMKMKIEINGCIEVLEDLTLEDFTDKFIDFIEENGWKFGGVINEYKTDKDE